MYFSFPVDPPICLLRLYYENHRGPKGIFLQLHFDYLWSNSTATSKDKRSSHSAAAQIQPTAKQLRSAVDLPVRYNSVLLTGPLSSNKRDGCRTVRTMHLPGFFSSVPPACKSALVAGTPNFRTSFQMFIKCKMGLEPRESHTTMVTPFAETNKLKHAAIPPHNRSVGLMFV